MVTFAVVHVSFIMINLVVTHIYLLNSVCFKAIFCYNVGILNKLSSSLDATWKNKRLIYGLID